MRPPQVQYINLEYFFAKYFQIVESILRAAVKFGEWLKTPAFMILSMTMSALLLFGIFWVIMEMLSMRRKTAVSYEDIFSSKGVVTERKGRWDGVKKKLDSLTPSDWKMAIIEADSLIDEILKKIGREGDDLGERLKSMEPGDFDNLQNVWEAHKVRNRIAHDASYEISKEEAKKILEKYEKALKELKYL